MPVPPDTRISLIRRLPSTADSEAWCEFMDIYEPLLFRLARQKGMQSADAEDFVQEVMVSVSKSIDRWLEAESRGPFRAWLFRIASNLAINFLTRKKHRPLGTGDTNVRELLEQQADPNSESSTQFALEYRRELFRWAAEQVQKTVSQPTWNGFWQTTICDRAIAEVAKELQISVGAVYIARSRVTKRITELIRKHEEKTS